MLRWLPSRLLARWLNGRSPLAVPLLGPAASENALWRCLVQPLEDTKTAGRHLGSALWAEAEAGASATSDGAAAMSTSTSTAVRRELEAARLAIRLMAAWQEMFEEARRASQAQKATSSAAAAEPLPAVATTPLLLASDGKLHPASDIRWPSSDFAAMRCDLQLQLLKAIGAKGGVLTLHAEVHALLAEAAASPPQTGRERWAAMTSGSSSDAGTLRGCDARRATHRGIGGTAGAARSSGAQS